jgi:DNA-directed RNA polymerase subunit M/transcription elongation factor TFIIS
MIHMSCPSCGATLKAPDDAIGGTTKCPECGTAMTVSEPIYDAEAIPDSGAAGAGSSPPGEERRPCPMCGEMIVATAAKCRYCGEIFDPALKKIESLKQAGTTEPGADMSTGDWVVALICSGIGCIAGIVWMIQGKPKGKKMFAVSLVAAVFWGIVRVIIEAASKQ